MIYFVQDVSTYRIKIGLTESDALDRIRDLQTGNSSGLILLAAIPGNRQLETELHRRFAGVRVRGEWFEPSPALLRYILVAQAKARILVTFNDVVETSRLTPSEVRLLEVMEWLADRRETWPEEHRDKFWPMIVSLCERKKAAGE